MPEAPKVAGPKKVGRHTIGPHDFVMMKGGPSEQIFNGEDPEVLVEGPAGTGKTRTDLEYVHFNCELVPGCRVLLCRKSRKDMTDTVLTTWERDVLPPRHPARRGPSKTTRHSYTYPNGAEVVIGGLDDVGKTFSGEYDIIVVHEATQITQDDWEKLKRCMRSGRLKFPRMIAECNPDSDSHWLNRAATQGRLRRITFTFEDNPTVTEKYKETLRSIAIPHIKARLYDGKWVSAEGAIYESFNADTHVLDGRLYKEEDGYWRIEVAQWDKVVELVWFVAGVDFGFAKPGCLQVWGLDAQKRAFMVHEVYQTKRDPVWWTEKLAMLHAKFKFRRVVCDPSRPDNIRMFNHRLVQQDSIRLIKGQEIATGGKNEWWPGVGIVRERLNQPSLFLLGSALEEIDPEVQAAGMPVRTAEEFPSYVYLRKKDGTFVKELPDPACPDHGLDTCRYVSVFLDEHDWAPLPAAGEYDAGSYGAVLKHEDVEFTGEPMKNRKSRR
jgi:phage terminase large subunit